MGRRSVNVPFKYWAWPRHFILASPEQISFTALETFMAFFRSCKSRSVTVAHGVCLWIVLLGLTKCRCMATGQRGVGAPDVRPFDRGLPAKANRGTGSTVGIWVKAKRWAQR